MESPRPAGVSVVIPAYNEAGAIVSTIQAVEQAFAAAGPDYEILAVDDGSTDGTYDLARSTRARVLRHGTNIGYGNAIMTGVRHARHPLIAIADADGSYPLAELPSMVEELRTRGLDMLVGARRGTVTLGGPVKRLARRAFRFLSEYTVGRTIPDINSGLRVMRRDVVMGFAPYLGGGFSFTTTITILSMLSWLFVDYRDIEYSQRVGKSHVHHVRDTLRAAQILVRTILIFNPIKIYLLLVAAVLGLAVLVPALCVLLPAWSGAISLAGLLVAAAILVLSLGFLAEQRAAAQGNSARYRREIEDPEAPATPARGPGRNHGGASDDVT